MKEKLQKKSNVFTSKADVLKLLSSKVKLAKIEEIFIFSVNEWTENQKKILKQIKNKFKNNLIVIRSSALDEDSIFKSGAGNYESILFVNPTLEKQIISAITTVVNSYKFKGNFNKKNQIIVQKQTLDSIINGVIFTRTPESGSPYYVINFNENNNTESVTKGEKSNVVKIFKNIDQNNIEKKWRKLIQVVKELEQIVDNDYIDIEFAISKKDIIIFQVRPITIINSPIKKNDIKKIENLIVKNKNKFKKLMNTKKIPINYSFFSDMSDWNPAEIIGNNPNVLDYSLYHKIIMKNAWHIGRAKIGYQKNIDHPLMTKFGNKPYVDIRASFYSLIPNNIKKKYKIKLMKFYCNKLLDSPYLHDKVEFEILFTCFDYKMKNRLNELLKNNFTKNEIKEIEENLIEFTNNIINEFPEIKNNCEKSIKKMKIKREEIVKKSSQISHSKQIEDIKKLLDDCKNLGTIPFSSMARIAFIASILLKSLQKKGEISNEFIEMFMNSIKTPLSEFQKDLVLLQSQKITKNKFLKKYGHLRPGTYDITAFPYNKQFSLLTNMDNKIKNQSKKSKNIKETKIKLSPLKFERILFLDFIRDALVERERIKFEFTKNLSEILEIIAKLGKSFGFKRNEIANLDIKIILNSSKMTKNQIKTKWKKEIEKEIKRKDGNTKLSLPSIIFSEKDFDTINYHISKPNFITTKKVTSKIIRLNKNEQITDQINNKIILIENADPGYDWIFTKKPNGLITKYGGVASHMSIRCAEVNLPAAIGCGELLFDQLSNSKKILLDCKNEQIISLEDSQTNELMEIKKTLKTLGYIK
jgi:glutamine kinase